ncbi:hypothetical protein BG22_04435 [Bifidobacterium sp. UTBIF-78]|nr:hypothetical protein BG22_04435 [Bifidobacterium sp. UTBIF-78]
MTSAAAIRALRRRIEGVGTADDASFGSGDSAGGVSADCAVADGVVADWEAADGMVTDWVVADWVVADGVVESDAEAPASGVVPSGCCLVVVLMPTSYDIDIRYMSIVKRFFTVVSYRISICCAAALRRRRCRATVTCAVALRDACARGCGAR